MRLPYVTNAHFTWIDHVLIPKHVIGSVSKCQILSEPESNLSDHLPILTEIKVNVYKQYKKVGKNPGL